MSLASIVAPEDRPGNVKFKKIYKRAKDKDVAEVVLGVNGTTLCIDDIHALTADEVRDCCEQGCIVQASGGFYRPFYWEVREGIAEVMCLNNSGSSGALVVKVFTSRIPSPQEPA